MKMVLITKLIIWSGVIGYINRIKNGVKFPVYSYAGYKWKYKHETEN